MDASQMVRLKELKGGHQRQKEVYAEEALKAGIVADAVAKQWESHLAATRWFIRWSAVPGQHPGDCQAFSISKTGYRYR